MSESIISNINNSVNTFSTTNDKNNSMNSFINSNQNKNCNKFNLLEEDLRDSDKIIKELASELEQSTAKANKLASNKKEIEENFKNICNKIQPINLKLNNLPLEQIPEQKKVLEKENETPKELRKLSNQDTRNVLLYVNLGSFLFILMLMMSFYTTKNECCCNEDEDDRNALCAAGCCCACCECCYECSFTFSGNNSTFHNIM